MAKVFHVTTVHPLLDDRIYFKECASLIRKGYDVTVLACSNLPYREHLGFRILSIGSETRNRLRRLAYQVRLFFMLLRHKPDIIHFHDPELLPMMYVLSWLNWKPKHIIYDVHEDVAAVLGRRMFSIPRFIYNLFIWIAKKRMTLILAEDGYKAILGSEHTIVRNFALNSQPIPFRERKKQIVYLGDIAEERGALDMVRGFAVADLKDWSLIVIGKCNEPGLVDRMRDEADRYGFGERLYLTGYVPLVKAMEIVKQSRIGLSLIHPVPNHVHSLSTKVFDYLSAELAVLLSNFPLYLNFFRDVPGVYFVDPRSETDVARILRSIAHDSDTLEQEGKDGRQYCMDNFGWESQEKLLFDIYEKLLSDSYC